MAEQYVLGVDVGTTNAKALLISEKGRVVAAGAREYPLFAPAVGRCEQRAQDWWGAVVSIVRELCADAQVARNVRGIAFSTQGGTIVPVDGAFEPISHAIVWNDRRCEEERQEFEEQFGADFMYQCSGWRLGAGLPALQVRHMRKRQSDVFHRAAMFLSVPGWNRLRHLLHPHAHEIQNRLAMLACPNIGKLIDPRIGKIHRWFSCKFGGDIIWHR